MILFARDRWRHRRFTKTKCAGKPGTRPAPGAIVFFLFPLRPTCRLRRMRTLSNRRQPARVNVISSLGPPRAARAKSAAVLQAQWASAAPSAVAHFAAAPEQPAWRADATTVQTVAAHARRNLVYQNAVRQNPVHRYPVSHGSPAGPACSSPALEFLAPPTREAVLSPGCSARRLVQTIGSHP